MELLPKNINVARSFKRIFRQNYVLKFGEMYVTIIQVVKNLNNRGDVGFCMNLFRSRYRVENPFIEEILFGTFGAPRFVNYRCIFFYEI